MLYTNKHFTDENEKVDGNEYRDCRFTASRIIYTGGGIPIFSDCVFDSCQWVFDGPAENTIQYFASLYSGLGQGGQELIEGVFDSIRRGGVGHGLLLPGTVEPAIR